MSWEGEGGGERREHVLEALAGSGMVDALEDTTGLETFGGLKFAGAEKDQ